MANNPGVPVLLTGSVVTRNEDCACSDSGSIIVFDRYDGYANNDCACADTPVAMHSAKTAATNLWTRTADVAITPLHDSFHLAFSPFAPAGPSVLNHAALQRWHTFSVPQSLNGGAVDQQLVAQRLIQPVGAHFAWQQPAPDTLTAWLHVTNACNLDCPYCYVRKSSAHMSEATGRAALAALFATATGQGFRTLKLKYAGGEASLHFERIRQLHEEATRQALENDIVLQEVMLSNGVHLRSENVAWMQTAGIKLAISLDGVGEQHDWQRPMRSGRGSFAALERTIDEVLLPLGHKPDITVTVTRLNADGVADAVRWALLRGLPVSLNFYRANPQALQRHELQLEEGAIIRGMEAAYRVFEELLPAYPFLNGLLDRVQAQAHTHTCGVGVSYLVITHEGKIAQCQMHLDHPVGSTLDGNLLHLTAIGPIHNLPVDEKEGCRDCTFRYRCTGGCALETFRATSRWDSRSPHCRIYKALYPQAMRLEGLRLLKVHGYLQ